ncbi:MAG: hypothetical protein LBT05_12235 [Planctomycetaceae bacterium]|jgi:hypothetical protein|nr:hypothetical protein [Planctomycetaceae bacterium]
MNRRHLLKTLTLGTAGITAFFMGNQRMQAEEKKIKIPKYPNEHFYKNGKWDQEVSKEAYRELFRYHNYAIGETVLSSPDFWMLEFGQNDFSNVGMGGIFFINDKEHGYFAHDIYLLPGQMIAQHYHIAAEDKPPKHETWHVRNGAVWTVALGGDKNNLPFELPKSQEKYTTCFKAKALKVGDIDRLHALEEPHFMIAGPEGAIVAEYASFHANSGLRFSNPTVK